MESVSIYEVKTQLSKYISMLINKEKDSIVITKNGAPVAEIVPYVERKERRIGIAKGLWKDISEEEFNDFDLETIMLGGMAKWQFF